MLLCGVLVSSPAIAIWNFRGSDLAASRPEIRQISNPNRAESTVQVPVEVIAAGSAPSGFTSKWRARRFLSQVRHRARAECR